MTAWILLFALIALFVLALRHGRPKDPPLPAGYDGERQLAELRALGLPGEPLDHLRRHAIAPRKPNGARDLSGAAR